MKKNLAKIFLISALICSVSFVSAADFGGSVDFSAYFAPDTFTPGLTNTLWFQSPISDVGTFSLEGSYSLSYTDSDLVQRIDLPLAKAAFTINPDEDMKMLLSLGRFKVTDASNLLFSQVIDGVNVGTTLSSMGLTFTAGYTGLTNAKSYSGLGAVYDQKDLYKLAPAMMVTRVGVSLPNFVGSHSFSSDISGFLPLEKNLTTSIFAEFAANGPINQSLTYNATLVLGVYPGRTTTAGVLCSGDLNYYLDFKSSSLSFSVDLATDTFAPFSVSAVTIDGAKNLNGALKIGLGYSIKPVSALLCLANFDYVSDIVGATLMSNSVQTTLALMYQIKSDVSCNTSFGFRAPLNGDDIFYSISAGFSLYY